MSATVLPNTFPGGIALRSAWPGDLPPLDAVPAPDRLFVPLYAPSDSLQSLKPAGTVVRAGEPLLAADADVATAALAPLPGEVVGARQSLMLDGRRVHCVELRTTTGVTDPVPGTPDALPSAPDVTPSAAQRSDWTAAFRRCGLYGDRKSCPNLINQLSQATLRPVDTVICSLIDQDPPLRLNALLAYHDPHGITAAVHYLASLYEAARAIVCIDASTPPEFLAPLAAAAARLDVKLITLAPRYPQGNPILLLHTLLDRNLRSGRSPVEKGVLLFDGPAAVAIGQVFTNQRPMLDVPVALRDRTRGRSYYLRVPVGTPLSHLLSTCGVDPATAITLRSGDALRRLETSVDAVVGPSELQVHILAADPRVPQPCVRCSWCADRCPTGVQPAWLLEAAQLADKDLAAQAGLDACIQCGICDHVCPSHLPLVSAIRTLKRAG